MMEIAEYRADGWPLCPNCGEDELWSPLLWDGDSERPPVSAYIAAGLRCYFCDWSKDPLDRFMVIGYNKHRSIGWSSEERT